VIVLNGASSTGKTTLGRCLQRQLEPGWLLLGLDDLLRALLPSGDDPAIFAVNGDGTVEMGEAFRRAQDAWYSGLAAIARQGVGLILDELFLDGGASQRRLNEALGGLAVTWVGVVCDLDVALERERTRGDRVAGLHLRQRERVHQDVRYDHVVDTTALRAENAAEDLLRAVRRP
jgi:chloramphenicol 3-O phosphotransferase